MLHQMMLLVRAFDWAKAMRQEARQRYPTINFDAD
jgi:hypothetical protein